MNSSSNTSTLVVCAAIVVLGFFGFIAFSGEQSRDFKVFPGVLLIMVTIFLGVGAINTAKSDERFALILSAASICSGIASIIYFT